MPDDSIARRDFLKGVSAAGASVALVAVPQTTSAKAAESSATVTRQQSDPPAEARGWLTLTMDEVAFFSAVADSMIPADELSPSGTDCGIPVFIDRQLASAWGAGAKMYRAGPFHDGLPEQGYQLSLTPREFFAVGVVAANDWSHRTYGKAFDRLGPAERIAALKSMEEGSAETHDIDLKEFFQRLLAITMEGFFSDPLYGGNRNKASWRMLGFPGLPATYADKMDEYRNKRYIAEPQSIVDFS
jgi:gluconate 2-dehydrogenase gamma chain